MRLKCSRCGLAISTEVPEETIVRAWAECPECLKKEQEWEKEFEDVISYENEDCGYLREWIELDRKNLVELVEKYLLKEKFTQKVKIKCKDGCIQIERIR